MTYAPISTIGGGGAEGGEWVVGGGGGAECVCVGGGGGCMLGDGWGHRIPRFIWYRSVASYFDRLPLPWTSGNPDPVATQCDWSLDPSVHWNATGEWIVRPSSVS